jgi:hypothetical protein
MTRRVFFVSGGEHVAFLEYVLMLKYNHKFGEEV